MKSYPQLAPPTTVRTVAVEGSSPLYTVSTTKTATTGSVLEELQGRPRANGHVTFVTRPPNTTVAFCAAIAFDVPAQLHASAVSGVAANSSESTAISQ